MGTATVVDVFGRPVGGVETGRGRAGAAGRVEREDALATFLADFTAVTAGRAVRARAERRDMRWGLGVWTPGAPKLRAAGLFG